jgi:hypothetical protein
VLKFRTHLELTCREDKLSIVITAEELKGTSIEAEAVVVTIVLHQTSQKTILLQM